MTQPEHLNHTAAFNAAHADLTALLAEPEVIEHVEALEHALQTLDTAAAFVIQGEPGELPAPPDPQPGALFNAARDVLGTYAHRELPAWGSAECAQLLAPLCYATQALELLVTLHALSSEAPST